LISLAQARESAREAYDVAEYGLDPAKQNKAVINCQGQLLLENLLPQDVELHCKPKLKNAKKGELFLRRIVLPVWRNRPLDLRRIVATELAGSRVPQELIERIKHVNDRLSWLAFKTRVHL
jgi:hypothetical protein